MENNTKFTISEEEIEENFNEFLELLRSTEAEGIEEMVEYLIEKTDLKTAPCSTRFHLCVPGGLVKHNLHVFRRLENFIKTEGLEKEYPMRSIIISSLCHDFDKLNKYEPCVKNVKIYSPDGNKRDEMGTFSWVSEKSYKIKNGGDRLTYGSHGENSVLIASRFIKDLTYDEMLAIRWHMGGFDWQLSSSMHSTLGEAFEKSKLALLLHISDLMAANIDEADMW